MRYLNLTITHDEYLFVVQCSDDARLSIANYQRKRYGIPLESPRPYRRTNPEKLHHTLSLKVENEQYAAFLRRAGKMSMANLQRKLLGLPFAVKHKMEPMAINPERASLAKTT